MTPRNRTTLVRTGFVLLTLILAVGAYQVGTSLVEGNRDRVVGTDPATESEGPVVFRDAKAGVELTYPGTWTQLVNNAQIEFTTEERSRLRFVAGPSQDQPAVRLTVRPLVAQVDFDPDMPGEELNSVLNFWQCRLTARLDLDDALVEQFCAGLAPEVDPAEVMDPSVTVLARNVFNDKGLLGFHFLYTFDAGGTGEKVAHSRFLLYDGAKLNDLVFEAWPESEFEAMQPTFDSILASFTSERWSSPPPNSIPFADEEPS